MLNTRRVGIPDGNRSGSRHGMGGRVAEQCGFATHTRDKKPLQRTHAWLAPSAQRLQPQRNARKPCRSRPPCQSQLETAGGRPHHRGGRPEPHRASCHTTWQLDETPARTEYGDNVYRHIHRYHCRFNSFRHPGNVGVDEARSCRRSAGGGYPVEPFRI